VELLIFVLLELVTTQMLLCALKRQCLTGTIIADVAEITETRPIRPAKRNYKLLSETLLSNAGSHPRGGSWMQLDETQGVLTLRRPLDREEACGTSLLCTIQLKVNRKSICLCLRL